MQPFISPSSLLSSSRPPARFFVFLLWLTISIGFAVGQSPGFTWLAGSDIVDQVGNYGTKGVPSSTNIPGARQNAMSWVDADGFFWLFGGQGYSTSATQGYLNDLWRYDVNTNQWTWISGSDTSDVRGIYGTLGVGSPSNTPGSRQNAHTWVDDTNRLWLFGGNGFAANGNFSYLNDLWMYDIGTGEWTWVSGANTPNSTSTFGTKGVGSTNNIPGARYGGNSWKDSAGNLWLFGGQENHGTIQRLNDLWKFNVSTLEWTWMNGSDLSNQNGIYGTKGTPSAGNSPGSRQASVSWTDSGHDFWLFGGYGFPESGATAAYLNDLWKYDVATNQWTWISGSNLTNQGGTYGTLGVPAANNVPGARQMSIGWVDGNDNLYLLGCWGFTGPLFGRLNDLWQYNSTSNQWTWLAGSNMADQAGSYGSLGVGSPSNIPGSRRMSVAFQSNSGDFYLFGGNGYDSLDSLGLLNDLWKIDLNAATGIFPASGVAECRISPNPASDFIEIVFSDKMDHEVVILDMQGRFIYGGVASQIHRIDLNNLPDGLYFIRIDAQSYKVLKN